MRLEPRAAAAYVARGNLYSAKRAYDRAIADYSAAIRLDPEDRISLYNRGIAYRATRDDDRAIENALAVSQPVAR